MFFVYTITYFVEIHKTEDVVEDDDDDVVVIVAIGNKSNRMILWE